MPRRQQERVDGRWLAGLTATVALIGAGWWWLGGDAGGALLGAAVVDRPMDVEPDAPSSPTGDDRLGPLAPGAPSTLPSAAEPGPPPPVGRADAQVRGRVLRRADRSPVPDVSIELMAWWDDDDGGDYIGSGRSDATGCFEVTLPMPVELDAIVVGAGPDTVPSELWGGDWTLTPGETLEVELLVDGGLVLEGRVVDAAGAARSDATVRAWLGTDGWPDDAHERPADRSARTDGAGRFRLAALGPGFVVDAVAPGARSRRRLLGRATSGQLVLEQPFVLGAERWIDIRVRDLADLPVLTELDVQPDAVMMDTEARTAHGDVRWQVPAALIADTDGAGRARAGPLTDEPWRVTAVDTRYPRWRRVHAAGDGPLSIVLGAGVVATGHVTDVEGRPLVGARVEFECQTGQRGALTDAGGRFVIEGVDPGPVGYGAWAPGHALRRHTHDMAHGPLSVALAHAAPLRLRVVDGEGRPLSGVRCTPHDWRFDLTWIERMLPGERSTDGDGRVDLDGLAAGEHVLRFERRSPRLRRELAVATGAEVRTVVLGDPRRLTLVGRVTDARDGAPISRFSVQRRDAVPGASVAWQHDFETADGSWEWELAAVPLSLVIDAEGYAPWHRPTFTPLDDPTRVDAALHPVRSLVVEVFDAIGRPARGWLTAVELSTGEPRDLVLDGHPGTWTDDACRAVLADLPATLIEVTARNEALGAVTSQPVDLSAPGPHGLRITLAPGPRRPQDVVVLGGAAGVGHTPGLCDPWTLLSEHGPERLWPVRRAVTVRVSTPEGELRDTLHWPAELAGAPGRLAPDRDPGAAFARLSLPAEALVIEVSAEGSAPVSAVWAPAGPDVSHSWPLVFVLGP